MVFTIPLALALILSFVYILSSRFSRHAERYHEHILSLGSGMLLGILFAEILPSLISEGTAFISPMGISGGILAGFVSYHLIEKYTYKHATSSKEITKDIGYLHIFGFFVDNFLEGFVLVLIFGLAAITNYLIFILFIPLLLGDIAAAMTLQHINDRFKLHGIGSILMSMSIFFGAAFGVILNLTEKHFYIALAFIAGSFLYFITRDELPRGRKGQPLTFLIGLVVVMGLFVLIRSMS